VLAEVLGDAGQPRQPALAHLDHRLGSLQPLLDLAHGRQVLVKAAAVRRAELPVEPTGILGHEIQNPAAVARTSRTSDLGRLFGRPNSSRGLISLPSGVDGVRQDRFVWYAKL
jgi:hypothetical protein